MLRKSFTLISFLHRKMFLNILLIFIIVIASGCGTKEKQISARPSDLPRSFFPSPVELYRNTRPPVETFESSSVILNAYRLRGDVFYEQKRYDRAIDEYEGALSSGFQQGPESIELLRNLSCSYAFSGDRENHNERLKDFFKALSSELVNENQ